MKKLEEINGQQPAIDQILTLRAQVLKRIVFVVGPPGAGTTWTLESCAKAWEEEGNVAVSAKGEAFASDRRLFPWLTMCHLGSMRLARIEVLKETVAQSSRAVPVVGSVTSYLVQEVLNHEKHRLARQALYHRYFLGSNAAALLALSGDVAGARNMLSECGAVLNQFYPAIQATMRRRHELFLEVVEEGPQMSPRTFDDLLLRRYPSQLGSQWAFYGRGFLLLQQAFTSTIARGLSLVAIVVAGLTFAFGEGGSKRVLAGVLFGVGMAIAAVNFLSWLFPGS
jgi:hypothetical protein